MLILDRYLSKYFCLILLLILSNSIFNNLNAQNVTNTSKKAVLIYKFAEYIEWQNEEKIDTFKIGILSSDKSLKKELKILETIKLKNKPISVIEFNSIAVISKTHIIVVTSEKNSEIGKIKSAITGNNSLLITDNCSKQDLILINFIYSKNGQLDFEINKANIIQENLTVKPELLLLGGTEIDIAELYKESQRSLNIMITRMNVLEKELMIELDKIDKSNIELIEQKKEIDLQKNKLNEQIATIKTQEKKLSENALELKQQQQILDKKLQEINQKEAEINKSKKVLAELNRQIVAKQNKINIQKNELKSYETIVKKQTVYIYLSIGIALVFFALTFTFFQWFRIKRKTARQLKEKEAEISTLFELAPLPIIISSVENDKILYVNKKAIDIFKLNPATALDQLTSNYYQDINQKNKLLADLKAKGRVDDFEIHFKDTEGGGFYTSLSGLITEYHGTAVIFVAINDITERMKNLEKIKMINEELESQKNELEKTLKNLRETQEKMVHSEKMASLGILTAGIAHEINNPINFVYAGISSLLRDFEDIEPIISAISKINPDDKDLSDKLKRIEKLKVENYFNESFDAIPEIIKDIKMGADRTAEIVKGLRSFSRTDEGEMYEVDIHECINNSLLLLHNKYKNSIEIVKNFDKSIPEFNGYAGKINQAMLNIISNAIDSITEKGEIIISTYKENDNIVVSVKDNGSGIAQENIVKLFDPFYTTKPIGQGTGLGLSITYGIIKEHNGTIEVVSEINKGSEFIIRLPIS